MSDTEIVGLIQRLAQHESDPALSAYWRPLPEMAVLLRSQGLSRNETRAAYQLRDMIKWGVLSLDGQCARDTSDGPGRPVYELNLLPAIRQIQWWKALPQEDRARIQREAA